MSTKFLTAHLICKGGVGQVEGAHISPESLFLITSRQVIISKAILFCFLSCILVVKSVTRK